MTDLVKFCHLALGVLAYSFRDAVAFLLQGLAKLW
jgi:hypothetical protein